MRSSLVFVTSCAIFFNWASMAQPVNQHRAAVVPVDLQHFLAKLRPNTNFIPGNKWGWKLGHMNFVGAYEIGDKAIGLVTSPTLDVLLDLRTGNAEELDAADEGVFYKSAMPFRLTNGGQPTRVNPRNVSTRSIRGGGSCTQPFNEYIIVQPRGDKTPQSFFVVGVLPQPVLQHWSVCVEGAMLSQRDIRSQAFDVLPMPFELSDGTIFIQLDLLMSEPFQQALLRLDDQGHEHSTLGGEIYLLDAKPIQQALATAAADPDALRTIIQQALLRQHNINVE